MKVILVIATLFILNPSFGKEILCPANVADPAIVSMDGKTLIMGTGDILEWDSLSEMMSNKTPKIQRPKLFQEVKTDNGKVITRLNPDELPWDLQFYTFAGIRYLYGGVMSPRENSIHAEWPQDNIARRINVATFDTNVDGWVFKAEPVFGQVSHEQWKGHSYGQQIISHGKKKYLLHEEITQDGITEIYLRRLLSPTRAGLAKKIIGVGHLKLKETRRLDGGHLLEGPRYSRIKVGRKILHLIYFSTGDFPTTNYATRIAYSEKGIEGPYKVLDRDLTKKYAKKNKLYGVGRAFPFTFKNKQYIIFHGAKNLPAVDHSLWPADLNEFNRCLFVVPVQYKWLKKNLQVIL